MASDIYWSTIALIFAAIIWAGAMDCLLWRRQQRTITDALREHPSWYMLPALSTILFLVALATHLYLSRR